MVDRFITCFLCNSILVEPKFKAGSVIIRKKGVRERMQILDVDLEERGYLTSIKGCIIRFEDQDNYELVPNFDIMNDIIKDDMETITINDFKANTKEWLIDKLHSMTVSDAIKTISNIHDELHKPQYPKTYEECCMVLKDACMTHKGGYKGDLIQAFQKLLICRDAYWQIAGEQMGLDKLWIPDLTDDSKYMYHLHSAKNKVSKGAFFQDNHVLAFPTEEMRDTFYENFKDLIESCKEFL